MEPAELTVINVVLWQLAAVVNLLSRLGDGRGGPFFWAAWGITSSGASMGVFLFWHFGKWWVRWMESRWADSDRPVKVFTPRRRRIVRLKNGLGLPGLLFCLDSFQFLLRPSLGPNISETDQERCHC